VPLEIVVIGRERAAAKLRASGLVIGDELHKAAVEASLWVEESAKMFVPVGHSARAGHSTGNLQRNISGVVHHPEPGRWIVGIRVGPAAPYGEPVEKGTGRYGPYKHPYFSRYRLPTGHEGVYLHPGMRPRPYIEPAFRVNERRIDRRFAEAGHRIAQRIS
jgi:hypothetical protein